MRTTSASGARAAVPVPPSAIAVLAVKAEPLRGRFARLDRCARRWPFGFQVALVTKSGRKAASDC
jgi:hypothetical protein